MVTIDLSNIELPIQLSGISHPLEGISYLIVLALIFRWRWPNTWNDLLKRLSAPLTEEKSEKNSDYKN